MRRLPVGLVLATAFACGPTEIPDDACYAEAVAGAECTAMGEQERLFLPPASSEERALVQRLCAAPCVTTKQVVHIRRRAGPSLRLPLLKKLTGRWELVLYEDEGRSLDFGDLPSVSSMSIDAPALESLEGFYAPKLELFGFGGSPRVQSLKLTNPLPEGVSVSISGTKITSLEGMGLEGLNRMGRLTLGQVLDVDLAPLRNVTEIKDLQISMTGISSLAPFNPQLRVAQFFQAANNSVLTDCELRALAVRTGAPERTTSIRSNQPCP